MPLYQTSADEQNELDVAIAFSRAYGVRMTQFPAVQSSVDWLASKDDVAIAVVEIKCRKNAHDRYDTYFIDKEKVEEMKRVAASLCITPFLAVRFTDGSRVLNVAKVEPLYEAHGGRFDRNDANDIDLLYHYDPKAMTPFG